MSVPENYWFSVVHLSGAEKWIDAVGDLHGSFYWEEQVVPVQQSNPDSEGSEENAANESDDRKHRSKGSSPASKRRRRDSLPSNDEGTSLEQEQPANNQSKKIQRLRLVEPLSVGDIQRRLAEQHEEVTEVCQVQLCKENSSAGIAEKLYPCSVLSMDDLDAITSGNMMLRYLILGESNDFELDPDEMEIPEDRCVHLTVRSVEAIPTVVDALENGTNILSLLSINLPLDDFANELANSCSKSQTLSHIEICNDIRFDQIQNIAQPRSSMRHILDLLRTSRTLICLDLSEVGVRGNEAAVIGQHLATNTVLRSLGLYGNFLHSEGAFEMARALKKNTTLRALDLDCNRIGPLGAVAIARALGGNETLLSINLARNEIGNDVRGVEFIGDMLRRNKTLRELNLNSNEIVETRIELTEVADALKANTSLRSLSLEMNQIGIWAPAIAETLEVNATLEILGLGDCGLQPCHVAAVAKTLKSNVTLRSLSIHNNDIGMEGAAAIAEALAMNSTLESLDLNVNPENKNVDAEPGVVYHRLDQHETSLIAEALQRNSTLTNLNLECASTTAEDKLAIEDALCRNQHNKQREEVIKKPYSVNRNPNSVLKLWFPEDFE